MIAEYKKHVEQRRAEDLERLLILWHHIDKAQKITQGFREKSVVTGDGYRASRQHDASVLDDDLDASHAQRVGYHIEQMRDPHRSAIYALARNLVTGVDVWRSPRLPKIPAERDAIVAQARQILTARLIADGLIE